MDKSLIIEKAIQWAKGKGFSEIKANHEDYETPSHFTRTGDDLPYIPDITGIKMGSKNYVEIATKTDETERLVSKWKLLATMAGMKGGKLFLLAPKGHKSFTEGLVDRYSLNAEVIYLK
ncbi:MAG: hypothetical protein AAF502_23835 [Bacteroidota bacterium]